MSEDIQKKIDELEFEMGRTQKNKATNYHLGTLKAKIAKLKSELINGPGGKAAGTKNAERGFDVTKSGDTRIGLVGFPSVGKSTLLTTLTGTRSEVYDPDMYSRNNAIQGSENSSSRFAWNYRRSRRRTRTRSTSYFHS
jgi:ribosome-interacting GTPase 1